MQMKVMPSSQSKTPVAQMHFASEHYLSKGTLVLRHIGGHIQANSGSTNFLRTDWSIGYGS